MEEETRKSLMKAGAVLYRVTDNGCWLTVSHQPMNSTGFIRIMRQGKLYFLHRVAWELHHNRKVPDEMVVSQSCGNGRCISPEHLGLLAPEERTTKKHRAKLRGQDEFPALMLTEDRVEIVKRLLHFGATGRLIMQVFGITSTALAQVERGALGLS